MNGASTWSSSKALDLAHDIRKVEIELYWKRAGYFWALIAAAFAGYFALQRHSPTGSLPLLISCVGFFLALGWYLVNRGSKYWQENWERHVDVLETHVVGPLYKATLSKELFSF
jgi:lipopolysaccharide export LptBFGC system permease protein LptF